MPKGSQAYHLIVFNSNTTIAELRTYVENRTTEVLVFLSSHMLFEHERKQLTQGLDTELRFFHFGSFNQKQDLLAIDKHAYEENRRVLELHSVYINRFKNSMNYARNAVLFKHLSEQFQWSKITVFCSSFEPVNLGISKKFWKERSADIIDITRGYDAFKAILNHPRFELLIHRIKALFNSLVPLQSLSFTFEGQSWLIHDRYRLKLKEDLKLSTRLHIPAISSRSKDIYHLIGLHKSGKFLNLKPFSSSKRLVIAGDAYRPEIYPPYLFAYPFGKSYYIPRDKSDLNFFKKHGLKTLDQRPFFLQSQAFEVEKMNTKVKTVVLSINHAGDWSALINRSDTDILLEAFCKLASEFPVLDFIIRPHPTMSGPRAEGVNALKRIKDLVDACAADNLEISDQSLEQDWKRGDLFISEYSLSVIDAMKHGKMGLFCNLTNRLNFMEDWGKMGFACVDNYADLKARLESALESDEFAQQNFEALQRYRRAVLL